MAQDAGKDCALWRSDGTESGTKPVTVFGGPCAQVRNPIQFSLATVNGEIYFSRDDGIHGAELWKSDGTGAGTVLVRDIRPGEKGSYPGVLTELDGSLFFFANDGMNGSEPYLARRFSYGSSKRAPPVYFVISLVRMILYPSPYTTIRSSHGCGGPTDPSQERGC